MTPSAINSELRPLLKPLEAAGRRLRHYALIEGLALLLVSIVCLGALQFAADRLLALGTGPRALLMLLVAFGLGRVFWKRVVQPLRVSIDVTAVAALIEKKRPDLGDSLLSAVAFAKESSINPNRNSPALVTQLVNRALSRVGDVESTDVLRADRYRRFAGITVAALIAMAAVTVMLPETLAAYFQRNWMLRDAPWPSTARIVAEGFEDGILSWPLGDDLTIVASAVDTVPDSLIAEIESEKGASVSRMMDRRGDRQFVLDYGTLSSGLRLRFRIGRIGVDERTRWYQVVPIPRPFVKEANIRITPPGYTRQPPFSLPEGQIAADIIRGSVVNLTARMSQPIEEASLKRRGDESVVGDVSVEEGAVLSALFEPDRRGTFYFDVRDHDGLEDNKPVTFLFNLLNDPAPKVRLTMPGLGEMVVPDARPTLVIRAEDNLGLSNVVLNHRVERAVSRESEESESPTPEQWESQSMTDVVPYQLEYDRELDWTVGDLAVAPGDRITVQVLAQDHQPVETIADNANTENAPNNTGLSIAYTLRVVTPEELRAELGRRESEWRGEFERIVKTQRQLNVRILEVFDSSDSEGLSASISTRLSQESRTQRQIAGRVRTVLRQFEQLYSEMEINGLLTPTVRRRLGGGVIGPMRDLASEQIPAAADKLDALRGVMDVAGRREAEARLAAILAQMQDILSDMLKWEGYNEAVTLLQDILRLQEDISQDTRRQLERELEALFETGNQSPKSGDGNDDQ